LPALKAGMDQTFPFKNGLGMIKSVIALKILYGQTAGCHD